MKKLAIALFAIGMSVSAFAEKVGVVDARAVMEGYKQTNVIYKALNDKKNVLENDIKTQETALQKKKIELDAKGPKLTDEERKNYNDSLAKLQKDVYDKQMQLSKEETAKIKEIQTKIDAAVKKVAADGKYDYIFEINAIMHGGEDITQKVIAEVNK